MTDTLRFTDLPQNPNQMELDAIMRQVTDQLGETWTAARLGELGYWAFFKGHPGVVGPILSMKPFIVALGDATDCTIVNEITL